MNPPLPLTWTVRRDFSSGSTRLILTGGLCPDVEAELVALLHDADLDAPLTLVIDTEGVSASTLARTAALLGTWAAGRGDGPELVLTTDPLTPGGRLLHAVVGQQATVGDGVAGQVRAQRRATARRAHLHLASDWQSPAAGRRLVAACCRIWDLGKVTDQALVVTSELITNAVQHAGTDIDFTVANADGSLRLSVRDRASGRPRTAMPADGGLLVEGGRGLPIVEALATAWGFLTFGDGKTVWAAFGSGQE